MKKIFKFVAISFAILAGACTNEAVESPLSFTRELTFTASREGVSPDTKTVRMDDGSTWWNASEEISVFHGSGTNGGSKLTSQNTTQQEIVEFSGSVQMSGSGKEFWAVYPYSQDNACDGSSITTVIPATQTASEGNFSGDAFPAMAKSKTLDLAFWNICGGIKFSVTRNDINSITFKGNNGETIAGTVKVSFGSDGKPTVLEVVNGVSEVTIIAPEGECFKAKKYYYITLLPGTLSGGFTMTFNATSAQGSVVSEKPQTVKRSVFGVLNRIDAQVDEWLDTEDPLKGLAFVPEKYFAGLGLISMMEFYSPKLNKSFPFVKAATSEQSCSFLCATPTRVAYTPTPLDINPNDYDFNFVNRKVYTKAETWNDDLMSIVSGPTVSDGQFVFYVKLNKAIDSAQYEHNNDVVALKATPKNPVTASQGGIISDGAYIEKCVNYSYYIVHKDGFNWDDPKYYRWESFVTIDDPTDYNAGLGISTPPPGYYDGTNPASLALQYDESIDLLDYVETFAYQRQDLASNLGITPTYTFQFAGIKEGSTNVVISNDPYKAPYLSADIDKTNQNQFIIIEGSRIRVNDAFVSQPSPAIGRTPLIYVQSLYNGKPLAECLIKIEIIDKNAPAKPKGWDVFIWHDATFKYDNLTRESTYRGESGSAYAPRLSVGPTANKDLNVTDEEFNSWVLADKDVNMSTQDFLVKYDTYSPRLILTKDGKEPGSVLPQKDNAVLVDIGDLNTYYSRSGTGLTLTKQSPSNWQSSSLGISLSIDNSLEALNDYDVHYVYVLYPAIDNTKNIDVVVKFSFTVEPHVHNWTILRKYNYNAFWTLNTDCLAGLQDQLVEPKPNADAYYGNEPYATYGAVRFKFADEYDMRTAFVEHFTDNAQCWKNANEESIYVFKIYNYRNDVVDIVDGDACAVKGNESGYATVTISGADLRKMANPASGIMSPLIFVRWPAGLSDGKDILVQVTELCSSVAGTAVKDLKAADYGKTYVQAYYYVVFEKVVPEAVDLGLPSGLKWATMNVGATRPEEYGKYFSWGETQPKSNYSWSTYKWCNGSENTQTKYNTKSSYGTVDNKTVLDPEDDAAHVNWGGSWRMPTDEEWTELSTKCTWTWTTQNGVNGRLVTGPNGNSIFLPAAGYRYDSYLINAGSWGYYCSSSLTTDYPNCAYLVGFLSDYVGRYRDYRSYGHAVRPVSE